MAPAAGGLLATGDPGVGVMANRLAVVDSVPAGGDRGRWSVLVAAGNGHVARTNTGRRLRTLRSTPYNSPDGICLTKTAPGDNCWCRSLWLICSVKID